MSRPARRSERRRRPCADPGKPVPGWDRRLPPDGNGNAGLAAALDARAPRERQRRRRHDERPDPPGSTRRRLSKVRGVPDQTLPSSPRRAKLAAMVEAMGELGSPARRIGHVATSPEGRNAPTKPGAIRARSRLPASAGGSRTDGAAPAHPRQGCLRIAADRGLHKSSNFPKT
jgi:hypothetical protein